MKGKIRRLAAFLLAFILVLGTWGSYDLSIYAESPSTVEDGASDDTETAASVEDVTSDDTDDDASGEKQDIAESDGEIEDAGDIEVETYGDIEEPEEVAVNDPGEPVEVSAVEELELSGNIAASDLTESANYTLTGDAVILLADGDDKLIGSVKKTNK